MYMELSRILMKKLEILPSVLGMEIGSVYILFFSSYISSACQIWISKDDLELEWE